MSGNGVNLAVRAEIRGDYTNSQGVMLDDAHISVESRRSTSWRSPAAPARTRPIRSIPRRWRSGPPGPRRST